MPLAITELHAPATDDELFSEWFTLENTGATLFNAKGCVVAVSRGGARPRNLGNLDPGFVLKPGEKIRVITGGPPKDKKPATEDGKTYYLFLKERVLANPGTTVHFSLKQNVLCRATFSPDDPGGIAR